MERIHGLRARVVRSLHVAYPRFLPPAQHATPFSDDLSVLDGMVCLASWSRKISGKSWHLYFKFRHQKFGCILDVDSGNDVIKYEGYDLLKGFTDLHHNPDDGCYVLQIVCSGYTSIPVIMGLNLVSIGVSVSRSMRHHKVKLVLDARSYVKSQTPESVVIVLDPAMNARLHPWWRQSYYNVD